MESKESILISIKKLLGITEEYKQFDPEIIIHINSVLTILTQLGVGPAEGFAIEGEEDEWSDFIQDPNAVQFNAMKTYVYLRVKLAFDPPLSGTTTASMERMISELEWRLNISAETPQE